VAAHSLHANQQKEDTGEVLLRTLPAASYQRQPCQTQAAQVSEASVKESRLFIQQQQQQHNTQLQDSDIEAHRHRERLKDDNRLGELERRRHKQQHRLGQLQCRIRRAQYRDTGLQWH